MNTTVMNSLLNTDGISLVTGCKDVTRLARNFAKIRMDTHLGSTLTVLEDVELPQAQSLGIAALTAAHTGIILDVDLHPERLIESLSAAGSGLSIQILSRNTQPQHILSRIIYAFSTASTSIFRDYFVERIRSILHMDEFGHAHLKTINAMQRHIIAQTELDQWPDWFRDLPPADRIR